jgi:hypothetical protein
MHFVRPNSVRSNVTLHRVFSYSYISSPAHARRRPHQFRANDTSLPVYSGCTVLAAYSIVARSRLRRAVSSPRRNLRPPLQPPSTSASACVLSNSSHGLHARRAQHDVVRDVSAAVAVIRACRIDGTAGRSICDAGAHDGPARRRYDRPAGVCIPSPLCRARAYELPVGYDAPPDDLRYPDQPSARPERTWTPTLSQLVFSYLPTPRPFHLTRRRRSSRMCAGGHLYMRSGGSPLTTPPPPPNAPSRCMRAFTSLALEQNHCEAHVSSSSSSRGPVYSAANYTSYVALCLAGSFLTPPGHGSDRATGMSSMPPARPGRAGRRPTSVYRVTHRRLIRI